MKSLRILFSDVTHAVGEVKYLHGGKEIGSGAFDIRKKAELRILLPRSLGVVSVFAKIYDGSMTHIANACCQKCGFDLKNDTYSLKITDLGVGLYFFALQIESACGTVYGMKGRGTELVICSKEEGSRFQFSLVRADGFAPESFLGGIIYHIFVDRFNRGGDVPKREDAILVDGWEGVTPEYPPYPGAHLENNTFFGGTLYGIIDKLEYISSLGVSLIYLSPIFEAYSNHKYDTGNYMKVDEMFGGDEALKLLIAEAKRYGIGIILDGVFNHTGSDSIYFNKNGRYDTVGAYQSVDSPYYSWFDFQKHPDKYTCWWGIEILPRINPDVAACGEYIAGDGGVIEKYSHLGVAGFRLDVVDELSDAFVAKLKSKLREADGPTVLYGEVWEDASNKIAYGKRKQYFLGEELDGVMNYPLRDGIIAFLKNKDKAPLEYHFLDVMFNAPKSVQHMQMNLLGTHDTERIITVLAGNSADGLSNDEISRMRLDSRQLKRGISLLKMAYTILATAPGIPTVFYGDEVGLEGYKDPFNRRPFPWKDPVSEIREHYRLIGKIRRDNDVYKDGEFELLLLENDTLIFSREKGKEKLLTVVNNRDTDIGLSFGTAASALVSGVSSKKITVATATAEIIKIDANTTIKIV